MLALLATAIITKGNQLSLIRYIKNQELSIVLYLS